MLMSSSINNSILFTLSVNGSIAIRFISVWSWLIFIIYQDLKLNKFSTLTWESLIYALNLLATQQNQLDIVPRQVKQTPHFSDCCSFLLIRHVHRLFSSSCVQVLKTQFNFLNCVLAASFAFHRVSNSRCYRWNVQLWHFLTFNGRSE